MTNEEIIKSIHPDFYNKRAHVRRRVLLGFEVEEAMSAARKDEAIAFGKWITENAFEPTGINKWEQCYTKAGDETTYSTKQLYELFKKTNEKTTRMPRL